MGKESKIKNEGELIAFMILQRDGFSILETNWHFQNDEVDIIAEKKEALIFIHVKTRTNKKALKQSKSIDAKKIAIYKDAAKEYLIQNPSKLEIRFDTLNVIIGKDETEIEHIPNAF